MRYAIVDICNTLAQINEALITRGYDPSGHALPASLPIWEDESLYDGAGLHPLPLKVVRDLHNQGYRILYMTARPLSMMPVTQRWLESHQAPPGQLHSSFGARKGDSLSKLLKGQSITELGLLEDSPQEIESYYRFIENHPDIHVRLIIPRHDYNKHYMCYQEINL